MGTKEGGRGGDFSKDIYSPPPSACPEAAPSHKHFVFWACQARTGQAEVHWWRNLLEDAQDTCKRYIQKGSPTPLHLQRSQRNGQQPWDHLCPWTPRTGPDTHLHGVWSKHPTLLHQRMQSQQKHAQMCQDAEGRSLVSPLKTTTNVGWPPWRNRYRLAEVILQLFFSTQLYVLL